MRHTRFIFILVCNKVVSRYGLWSPTIPHTLQVVHETDSRVMTHCKLFFFFQRGNSLTFIQPFDFCIVSILSPRSYHNNLNRLMWPCRCTFDFVIIFTSLVTIVIPSVSYIISETTSVRQSSVIPSYGGSLHRRKQRSFCPVENRSQYSDRTTSPKT